MLSRIVASIRGWMRPTIVDVAELKAGDWFQLLDTFRSDDKLYVLSIYTSDRPYVTMSILDTNGDKRWISTRSPDRARLVAPPLKGW